MNLSFQMKDLFFQESDLRPTKVIRVAGSKLVYEPYDPGWCHSLNIFHIFISYSNICNHYKF